MAYPPPRHIVRTLVHALSVLSLLLGAATAVASPAVYRCKQGNGGMGYQDFPCADGVVVDIRPGVPNPDEIARLAQQQEAFDRSYARRLADELATREAAAARARQYAPAQDMAAAEPDYYYPAYGYGYGGYVNGDRLGNRNRKGQGHHVEHHRETGRLPAVIQRPHR